MMEWNRGFGLAMGIWALALAAPAGAQENLDSGKSGAQLFAANCAVCHKSPQALSKSGGMFGLSAFLREHYTSSRETAAVIATYLESLSPAPGKRTGAAKRAPKGDDKAKVGEKKGAPKSGEAKPEQPDKTAKPNEAKTSGPTTEPESKPKAESKPTGRKSGEAKPAEPKAKDAKDSKAKPAAAKTSTAKPAAAPAAKPDKPEKSD
jgi:hypothetical protein